MDAHTPFSLPHEDTEVRPCSHHNLEIPLNPQWEPPPMPLTPYLLLLEISVCVLKESLFYLFTLPTPPMSLRLRWFLFIDVKGARDSWIPANISTSA